MEINRTMLPYINDIHINLIDIKWVRTHCISIVLLVQSIPGILQNWLCNAKDERDLSKLIHFNKPNKVVSLRRNFSIKNCITKIRSLSVVEDNTEWQEIRVQALHSEICCKKHYTTYFNFWEQRQCQMRQHFSAVLFSNDGQVDRFVYYSSTRAQQDPCQTDPSTISVLLRLLVDVP